MDRWFEEHTEKEFSDVLLCAGLVHDIGNPPFGHFGEYAIREWFIKNLKYLSLGEKKVVDILSDWQQQDLYSFEETLNPYVCCRRPRIWEENKGLIFPIKY